MATAHVAYAYSPRQTTGSRGRYHLILNDRLDSGRLHREAGDVLCPKRGFWGLEPCPEARPTCTACLRLAERHHVTIAPPKPRESP